MTSESLQNSSLAEQLNEVFARPSGRNFDQMRDVEFNSKLHRMLTVQSCAHSEIHR